MRKSGKLVITPYNEGIISAFFYNNEPIEIKFHQKEKNILNNIYIAKVVDVVNYLNAAFINYQPDKKAYYAISDKIPTIFINKKSNNKVCPGDEILVQIQKENIKTKDPVATSKISVKMKHIVLTAGMTHLGFSSKIKDEKWKGEIKKKVSHKLCDEYGFIIRTNAVELTPEEVLSEMNMAEEEWEKIKETARHRTCYSLIASSHNGYIEDIKNMYSSMLDEIITDDKEIYDEILQFLEKEQSEDLSKLRFYEDKMLPLYKMYKIEKAYELATHRHVWLKSGAYLVIEPTEALTVFDVNTGKMQTKKKNQDAIMRVNKEAAKEISRQIRLRNISGIIIVDFINLEHEKDRLELESYFREYLYKDPIKTTLVETTKLNLVEITRKKVKKSFREQIMN